MMKAMASGDIFAVFKKGKVNACLELNFSVRGACRAIGAQYLHSAGGIRKIFALQRRKSAAVRVKCLFELIV